MSLGQTLKHLKRQEGLVTPRIRQFLADNPEGMLMQDGEPAPESMALMDDIMKRLFGSNSVRSGRFGASSRGTCHRAQMWTYLGMPGRKIIEPETWNLFNDGKWRHLKWQVMGVQSGALSHAEFSLPPMTKYRLTSSADGLNTEEEFLWELKGDRNMGRLLNAPKDADSVVSKHMLQIHTMFIITGWEKCSYVMEDKATNDFRERVVYRDETLIRKVRIELEELNLHVENRSIPEPLPACQQRQGPYRSCPFAVPCIQRWEQGNDYWPDQQGDWDS